MLYGVAMVGIGMLSHTGNNVAMDAFGPIADNANGIGEMAGVGEKAWSSAGRAGRGGQHHQGHHQADRHRLGSGGGHSSLFLLRGRRPDAGLSRRAGEELLERGIPISTLDGTIGFLLGGALPFLFSAFSLRAVARGANLVVNEVRRQFKIPGVLEGTTTPDYGKVVTIATTAAQKELVSLVALSVGVPLLVGLVFEVEALGTFLAGVILTGQLLAVFMAIAGGALDNAKKYVEDGHYGGKGSPAHKAGVEGDTVGDPLKDTAGPALNPMIKVVNLVSLLAAPLIIQARAPWACGSLASSWLPWSSGPSGRARRT